ncbi:MAG: hypothetical protein J6V47_02550 [Bacteroidaceae bacterium]|nr:hypothetical protein [Bacteroidaceae bacterium]
MKKLFVALMAVLVLASCGGDKKETANSVENQNTTENSAVTPADVIMMTVEAMNDAAVNLKNAATADDVIDATAGLYSEMKKLQANYGEVMLAVDTLSEEQMNELYPEEMKAMEEAALNYSVVMMGKAELIENLTPEQEARFMEILEAEL